MAFGQALPSPQHTSPHRVQDRVPAPCSRQPSSQPLQAQRPCRRAATASQVHRSQQLRGLRQVLLQAVRADQQGQQTDSSVLRLISDITGRVDDQHAEFLERGSRSGEGYTDPGADSELKARLHGSITKLSQGLLERETEVGHPSQVIYPKHGLHQAQPKFPLQLHSACMYE